jgi:hypothetical protein
MRRLTPRAVLGAKGWDFVAQSRMASEESISGSKYMKLYGVS